ncbi:MAG: hypothetical protein GYB67_05305 [Chloroflexi bacterium]|nr:hypothetical protein [Chloroflexota bacterium]
MALLLGVTTLAAAQDVDTLPDLPGKIAYIGDDSNVYVLDTQADLRTALTDDAERSRGQVRFYEWPTWSTDGRLAYFLTAIERFGRRSTEVFVSLDGQTAGELVYSDNDSSMTYAYWSPADCSEGKRCRDLAVLLGGSNEFAVEVIRNTEDESSSRIIGLGSPFYYSWSPDGTQMLWQRNNRRVDVYDVNDDNVENTLEQTPGRFFAPAWSPVDDRLLVGVRSEADENATDLVILPEADLEAPFTLVPGLEGPIYFAWSPDGTRVAYTGRRGDAVYVVDTQTGDTVGRSISNGILAFFWSPDSDHLAYVTLAPPPGSFSANAGDQSRMAAQTEEPSGLVWNVLDLEDDVTRNFEPFLPTQEFLYVLSFFDQFGQSHNVWSPDSRYLVYSAFILEEEQPVVQVIDTDESFSEPLTIADGVYGVWSYN